MAKIDYSSSGNDPKLGFYQIQNQIFYDKASALLYASKLNLSPSDLRWNFNDEFFNSYDWTIEPPGSIRDYYHIRARQIRDKYDYIILNFSGGSDSTTVLYSFIQQNLFIDEVIVRNPTAATKKYGTDQRNLSPFNEFSEFELAAKPILKWLEKVSPKTKITLHDYSLDIVSDDISWDENFFHWTGDYINFGCIVRYTHNNIYEHLKLFDKGKNIAILFGTDKPRVVYQNEDVNFYFIDRAVHSALPATVTKNWSNTNIELFYWSPDLPELIIKQCHLIKKWFEEPTNQNLSYIMDYWWHTSPVNRSSYEACVKSIIYPDYNLKTWQVNKTVSSTINTEWDFWMKDFKNTVGYKTFMRGYDHLFNNINKGFLMRDPSITIPGEDITSTTWEFKPCISKFYYLGKFKKT